MRKLQLKISGRCRTMKGATFSLGRARSRMPPASVDGTSSTSFLGSSPERFVEALDYPEEVFDEFENFL